MYRELKNEEINEELFACFNRYQEVQKCWRKENGTWELRDINFTEQWGSEEYIYLATCLQRTIEAGGVVLGAFQQKILVGFASIEGQLFGSQKEYLQLSSLHVTLEKRGLGIGKHLFYLACSKAKDMGAQKLYISAHSSKETMAFYKIIGCLEALEYSSTLVAKEPFDCQLEYDLKQKTSHY